MDGIAYQLGQSTALLVIAGAMVGAVAFAGVVLRYMARLTGMDRDRELTDRLLNQYQDMIAAVVEHQHRAKVRELEQGLATVLQAAALPARKGSTGEISWDEIERMTDPKDIPEYYDRTVYETFEQALKQGRAEKPKRRNESAETEKKKKRG